MSAIHTWACFLLCIGFATQDKTPDVTVTCFVSEECLLPCSFQPGSEEIIEWFRQDVEVYKFKREDEEKEDDDSSEESSEEHLKSEQLSDHVSVFPQLIARGNATLIVRRSRLNNPFLHWSFSNGEDPSHILTYDSQSGNSVSTAPWDNHVELDGFRVPFGDGSLRLMDPKHSEHTGSYTCVFSVPYNTHTEHTDVTIDDPVCKSLQDIDRNETGQFGGCKCCRSGDFWLRV